MKRREFIHNLSHAMAAGTILPHLNYLNASTQYSALNNTLNPDKILVILRFDGGNDGLNMITPMDQYSTLTKVRKEVIIPEKQLIQLSRNDLAFHPEFKDMKVLFEEKRMKIIQNVGYPSPDLSHFRSSDIWQSASNFSEFISSGWLGRLVEHDHPEFPDAYPTERYPDPLAIELGYRNSLLLTGKETFPGFIVGNPTNINEIINELDQTYPNTYSGDKLKYVQLISKQSNNYSTVIRDAYQRGNHSIQFPHSDLGGQFDLLSKLIRGGLNTRIYHAITGGFDTHDYQVSANDHSQGSHAMLLKNINDCVIALMRALDETGDSDRVMIVTFSEFGRRIVSRSTYGTDHGTAFPMMIFGNQLNANVLGRNPYIDPAVTWEDNLESEFDFRQIYASIIEQWLGGDSSTQKDVLFKDYPQVGLTKEYADEDEDGVLDKNDQCLNTASGAMVDTNGCEVFSLPPETFSVIANSTSCIGQSNGAITISTQNTTNSYHFSISNDTSGVLNANNNYLQKIENLAPGSYEICIMVDGISDYQRCYTVKIVEPPALNAVTNIDKTTNNLQLKLKGSDYYQINLNGQMLETELARLDLPLKKGLNTLKVSTNKPCQKAYLEEIFLSEEIQIFPNPTKGPIKIYLHGLDEQVEIKLTNLNGVFIEKSVQDIPFNRLIELNLSQFPSGPYLIHLSGDTIRMTEKIIKF